MIGRCLVWALLCAAPGRAQDASNHLELVEVARTSALGGYCEAVEFDRGQAHMLTVGRQGDLRWWDRAGHRVRRRIAPQGRYLVSLALHPDEPWALVCWVVKGAWEGAVWHVDLTTGACRKVLDEYASQIVFDAAQEHFAISIMTSKRQQRATFDARPLVAGGDVVEVCRSPWLPHHRFEEDSVRLLGDPGGLLRRRSWDQARSARGKTGVSADGVHAAEVRGHVVRRTRPAATMQPIEASSDTWIERLFVANDGDVYACDQQGQLHRQGPEGEPVLLPARHRGVAHRLVFSPDGRYLAVATLGGVHIVDLDGNTRLELDGTHIVETGPDGADFWLFGKHSVRRWSASAQRDVLPPLTWAEPAMAMLSDGPFNASALFRRRPGLLTVWTLGAAMMRDHHPWYGSKDSYSCVPLRHGEGGFEALPSLPADRIGPWRLLPSGRHVLFLRRCDGPIELDGHATRIDVLDASGNSLHHWGTPGYCEWFLFDAADQHLWLGTPGGGVQVLDARELTAVARKGDLHWLGAALWGDEQLLVSDGEALIVVNRDSLAEVTRFPPPEDLAQIDIFAVAPHGRHIVVADQGDVRILRARE